MSNKVRTILTLLGITIGIFAVISVFTVFDSLERELRSSINQFGTKVLFIQKWPWSVGQSDYPWWKYMNRPQPSVEEQERIINQAATVKYAAFMTNVDRNVELGSAAVESTMISGVSYQYSEVMAFDVQRGRYFTRLETNAGRNVALIGSKIKNALFGDVEAVGKEIKVSGRKVTVIGVLKEEGEDPFGESHDWQVLVPVNYLRRLADLRDVGSTIMVKGKDRVSIEEMKAEIRGIMRSARRLKPGAEDNFAVNETSILTQGFDQFFGVVSMVGWLIGGFSLLVGGFGIANIMFVSVKERISQIGIQKSLGAKKYFILLQFLFEAVFLSLIGGMFGLLFVFLGAVLANSFDAGIHFVLTAGNIILAIGVSGIIGLMAGLIPAFQASRLDPVEAMRSV
ncbi:MAG: ABC transporter permease [Bacteroidales bacterium]|nr:ABC transporter permease [Bacteroidales bacterium]MCF8332911.1 ABC transporter permease [Bacteroidales bacterium]